MLLIVYLGAIDVFEGAFGDFVFVYNRKDSSANEIYSHVRWTKGRRRNPNIAHLHIIMSQAQYLPT